VAVHGSRSARAPWSELQQYSGIAAAVNAPWRTENAVGVPKTGFPAETPAETMAHVAATNIASQIRGEEPTKEGSFGDIQAPCIMDAGTTALRSSPTRCCHRPSTGDDPGSAERRREDRVGEVLPLMKDGYVRLP
jgi:hypothetical protein